MVAGTVFGASQLLVTYNCVAAFVQEQRERGWTRSRSGPVPFALRQPLRGGRKGGRRGLRLPDWFL